MQGIAAEICYVHQMKFVRVGNISGRKMTR
jgi:hypothetical protein